MKITNYLGLPQPIVDAVANDPYDKGDAEYSITELIDPPRLVQLKHCHWADLKEDASDRIMSLIGQSVHLILERAEKWALPEERYYTNVDGVKIGGKVDRLVYYRNLLQDYKCVGVGKFKNGVPLEYKQQINGYCYLLSQNGFDILKLEVVPIFRDWMAAKSIYVDTYPKKQCLRYPVKMWSSDEQFEFLRSRVRGLKKARKELPLCTLEERWGIPDKWAIKKPGAKKAKAIYDNEREAKNHLIHFPSENYEIESRPGVFGKRCDMYCVVRDFCKQYKASLPK